jgi:hypothetical protein
VPHAPVAARRPAAGTAHAASGADAASADHAAVEEFTGKPVTLSVQIPKDLRKELKRLAERTGKPLDAVVGEALARQVERGS